jgi:tetratricopeptide (TPR) repeat protein
MSEREQGVVTPDSYIAIGNRQSQIGNERGALAAYDRAVGIAPGYARAYNYRGSFKYAKLRDIQGAIVDFDSAVR